MENGDDSIEKSKELLGKTKRLIAELKWKTDAPRILPMAKFRLEEMRKYSKDMESALTPEILETCRANIINHLKWFAKQEMDYPGAPWLLDDGAVTLAKKTKNRYNELLYMLSVVEYGYEIKGFLDRSADNYLQINDLFKKNKK